jgi:hypothetical protein
VRDTYVAAAREFVALARKTANSFDVDNPAAFEPHVARLKRAYEELPVEPPDNAELHELNSFAGDIVKRAEISEQYLAGLGDRMAQAKASGSQAEIDAIVAEGKDLAENLSLLPDYADILLRDGARK